ncbi:hypothetical protein ACVRXQ_12055 [Streptococcus panodentis]|uniref:Phage protein n=1 Tax=Streptococcus panodentis TaxID=1581472 RepID=A0ABS5AX92_9STRE|nr:hypothetical protein [Streptococcus panodentis]MBP2621135.1 hypothetical protein [Streptococcus panodentis]
MNKLNELSHWKHVRDWYQDQGSEDSLKKIKGAFGLGAMAQRRRWLRERIKNCDEQIRRLEGDQCE